jgi:hypothetical protein
MPNSYLPYNRRQELEGDKEYFEKQMNNPLVQDKPTVRKNLARVEHALETQSPPVLKGEKLDKVVRREKELREELVPNMLSHAEMRQAPPGSVGREMEFQKRYKDKIIEWKNCRRVMFRDSDDPDVANLEVYRPTKSRGNLDNAFIPGKEFHFASPQYQEGYDNIDWSAEGEEPKESFETEESKERRARLQQLREEMAALEAEEEAEGSPPRLGLEE